MWALALKIGAPLLIALGAYAWVTTGAYNRGVRDRDAAAVKIIAEQKKAVVADAERVHGMTPDELDAEFKKRCRAAGGTEEQCR